MADKAGIFVRDRGLDGWLVHDYRGTNPVFAEVVGSPGGSRRTCLVLRHGHDPILLVHSVDAYLYPEMEQVHFASREDWAAGLSQLFPGGRKVLAEYSPGGALPAMSYLDAGTKELLESLGFQLVSSADLYQELFATWTPEDLDSHLRSATKLAQTIDSAFDLVGDRIDRIREEDVVEFVTGELAAANLNVQAPDVAVNEHTGLLHYVPRGGGATIRQGDWILMDFLAGESDRPPADITWVGYAGSSAPQRHQLVFENVARARDLALEALAEAAASHRTPEGWEIDRAVRDFLDSLGVGVHFPHRLGHSLGRQGHGLGANLDDYETHDTRGLIPGLAFTIEPGLYFADFGVRSEVNVYVDTTGFRVTTPIQHEIRVC